MMTRKQERERLKQGEKFYDLLESLLVELRNHTITPRQFFLRLTRARDFKTEILLDVQPDVWVTMRRTARRKLRFEANADPAIIFWVGLSKTGKLRVTKTEALFPPTASRHGSNSADQTTRRKFARTILKDFLKLFL